MSRRNFIFTSESVTEGHPDKICDAIADAILDACLAQDIHSRVACEALAKTGMVVLAGEITTKSIFSFSEIARQCISDIGYTHSELGFDGNTCAILVAIDKQSPDISLGVTPETSQWKEQGAGDQGIMFGYACRETPELMPAPITYAHHLCRRLAELRKARHVNFLRPDGKSQVTIEYENNQPKRVDVIVVSTQHSPDVKQKELQEFVRQEVICKVIPANLLDNKTRYFVNPTGRFVIGGPQGDSGLTGRKIIVDTYGGMGRHGGGSFSGKDPSKVDRSASYMARHIAKTIVAAGLADRCELQLAYAIGYPEPVSIMVETFDTGTVADEKIEAAVKKVFNLKPAAIIEHLQLLRPIYQKTAAYGHFGRTEDLKTFRWERTDEAEVLKQAIR